MGGSNEVRRKQAASKNEYAEEKGGTRIQSLASHGMGLGRRGGGAKKIQTKGSGLIVFFPVVYLVLCFLICLMMKASR